MKLYFSVAAVIYATIEQLEAVFFVWSGLVDARLCNIAVNVVCSVHHQDQGQK
jgi:hypothetical protein